jgi:1,4-alpha-glucan branching enzyme
MWAHPGKKLLFMGCDIGQPWEWSHSGGVCWDLLIYENHGKLQTLVRELNRLYCSQPSLHEVDFHYSGFEWIDFHDGDNSIISFLRRAENGSDFLLFCCNFTPVPRENYRFGVPEPGVYDEILNTDSELFGGSNMGNGGIVVSDMQPSHGRAASISVTLPPLAVVAFRRKT